MTDTFFVILKGMFFPLWILFVLGIALCLYQTGYNKKEQKRPRFLPVICICAFMLLWRWCAHISSSRYSIALIIPAIGFGSYFLSNNHIPSLFRFVAGLICFAFLIHKDLRVDLRSNYYVDICHVIRQDSKGNLSPVVWSFEGNCNRLFYYCGSNIPVYEFHHDYSNGNLQDYINRCILNAGLDHDCIYIYLRNKRGEAPLKAKDVGFSDNFWKIRMHGFCDSHKKKEFYLYEAIKCNPKFSESDLSEDELLSYKKEIENNLFLNGDFEKSSSDKHFQNVLNTLKDNPNKPSYRPQNPLFWPDRWLPHNGYTDDSMPIVELTDQSISGKRSLFLSSQGETMVYSPRKSLDGIKDFEITFLARNLSKSEMFVEMRFYKKNTNNTITQNIRTDIFLDASKTRIYRIPIHIAPQDYTEIAVFFGLKSGALTLDDIALVPNPQTK